ncbi:MAG: hypothetical protein IBX45_08045 [Campylobacterales bacterium]|nr:hypothetical protein [Campylobacterales bacterium]
MLQKNFEKYLKNSDIKIVSFDIFDTLCFRTCGKPDEVFYLVGETPEAKRFFDTPSAFALYRQEAEKNVRKENNSKEEITLDDIYNKLPIPPQERKTLKQIELEVEQSVLVPNFELEQWIDMAYEAGKTVICISDMYLNSEQINTLILSKLSNTHKIHACYVSSEHYKTKATGNLFLHVMEALGISPHELLHVGDNERSDVAIPKAFGIHTFHYGLDTQTKKMLLHETAYMQQKRHGGHHVRTMSLLGNPFENDSLENFYYRLGAGVFGPILWEFSHWLAQIAERFELTSLFFIMREGGIFAKYFSLLYPNIAAKLLYASRKSTHFMALDSEDIGTLNPTMFCGLTLKNLYENFFLDFEKSKLRTYGDTPFESLGMIHVGNKTLLELAQDEMLAQKGAMDQALSDQKEYLQGYLESLHVNNSSAMVEFGGGGTVLKHLYNVLLETKRPKILLLFYQSMRGYQHLANHLVLSFLPHTPQMGKALESIARTPDFIEILLNGTYPTTLGYETDKKPRTKNLTCNRDTLDAIQSSLQKGIDIFFFNAKRYDLKASSFTRETLALMLARLIALPTHEEATQLGDLEYDEGKGSDHHYRIIQEDQLQTVSTQGIDTFYQHFLANPSANKHLFPWPQGVLTRIKENYLLQFYASSPSPNQAAINRLLEKIDALPITSLIVYGAGEFFKELLPFLKERGIAIEAVIDSRAEIKTFEVEGYRVVSLKKALKSRGECTILIASGVFAKHIKEHILTSCAINNIHAAIIDSSLNPNGF